MAVVTGAAPGIGRAIAIAFAEHGASVALIDRNMAAVEETASMVRQKGGRIFALGSDVGVEKRLPMPFDRLIQTWRKSTS